MIKYKIYYVLIILTFWLGENLAQESAFILVDVSGSMKGVHTVKRTEAEEIVREIIAGRYDIAKHDAKWEWTTTQLLPPLDAIANGGGSPLIDVAGDGYVLLMPFGNRGRHDEYRIRKLGNLNTEFNSFLDTYYPDEYTDQRTLKDLAEAYAAQIAKGRNVAISEYYLLVVSDNANETLGISYTKQEQRLLDLYGGAGSNIKKLGTLRYKEGRNFIIEIKRVTVSGISVPPVPVQPGNADTKSLSFTRPGVRSSKKRPMSKKPGTLRVSWKCLGCDSLAQFSLRATNTTDKKKRVSPIRTSGYGASMNLEEPGLYRLSLSGGGLSASPVYVKVSNESNGGAAFMIIFLLAILGAGGYGLFKYLQTAGDRRNNSSNTSTSNNSYSSNHNEPPPSGGGDEWDY